MPRATPNPEIVAQARELVAMGCSHRTAGETLGVTGTTIARWLAEPPSAKPPAPAVSPSAMPPPPSAPPALPAHMFTPAAEGLAPAHAPVNVDDPIALVKQLIREQHEQIHRDRAAGARGTSVSSAVATLEKLTKTLKQLEESDRKAGDGVTISSAEQARIEASLAERIRANCNRPLLCNRCSRELSVFFGTGMTEAELNAGQDSNVTPPNPEKKQ
jgi:hypothetical protein